MGQIYVFLIFQINSALANNRLFWFFERWLVCRQNQKSLFVRLAFYTDAQLTYRPAQTSPIHPMDGCFGQFLYSLFRFIGFERKWPVIA